MAQHYMEVTVGIDDHSGTTATGTRAVTRTGSPRLGVRGGPLLKNESVLTCCQDHSERCVWGCVAVQAAWQVMAAETVVSTGRGATQSSLCCAEGLRGVAALLLTQSRVCALAALCARSEGHGCTCVRQACSRVCRARGRSVRRRRDGFCSCCSGDQENARLRPAHRGHCSRGVGTEAQVSQPR